MDKQFENIQDRVLFALMNSEDARNSDNELYRMVCEDISKEYMELPFREAMQARNEYGIPPFETVRRSRQRMQNEYPELMSNKRIQALRKKQEKAYREYALGK